MGSQGSTARLPGGLFTFGAIALLVVYVAWSSVYVAVKVAITTLPPLASGGARFLVAALVLLMAVAVVRPASLRVTGAQLRSAALAGLVMVTFGQGLVVLSSERLASGLVALLVAAVPLWLVVLRAALGDRPPRATVVSVLCGFVGVGAVLVGAGGLRPGAFDTNLVIGAGLALGAAFAQAGGAIVSARGTMPANPFVTVVIQAGTGGAGLLLTGLLRGELRDFSPAQVSTASWWAWAHLAVVGALIGFSAYIWALRSLPVSTVGTYAYVNPALALVLGALLLHEPLTWGVGAGGVVILAAVALVVAAEGRARGAAVDTPPREPLVPARRGRARARHRPSRSLARRQQVGKARRRFQVYLRTDRVSSCRTRGCTLCR